MLTDAQLLIRKNGVGCSEVAATMGMSKWCTPRELFFRKKGAIHNANNLAMRVGNALESLILDEFAERHPELSILIAPDTLQKGILLGHLDAWAPGECTIQAKTAVHKSDWGEEGTDQIPTDYLIQVQAEMLLAGERRAYVPVLFSHNEYAEYIVQADPDLQAMCMQSVDYFWAHVERNEPPPPKSMEEVLECWGKISRKATVEATEFIAQCVQDFIHLQNMRKELEEDEERIKTEILKHMREAEILSYEGQKLCTWTLCKGRTSIDGEKLKQEHPEIYTKYQTTGNPYRRFTVNK